MVMELACTDDYDEYRALTADSEQELKDVGGQTRQTNRNSGVIGRGTSPGSEGRRVQGVGAAGVRRGGPEHFLRRVMFGLLKALFRECWRMFLPLTKTKHVFFFENVCDWFLQNPGPLE